MSVGLVVSMAFAAWSCRGNGTPAASAARAGEPLSFAFSSLDEKAADSDSFRGKPCIVSFFSTGDLSSQAQTNYLVAMAAHDVGKVGYLLVALEPPSQRELIEIYRKALKVTFAVAMADEHTLAGKSTFGAIPALPTVVVLDGAGKVAKRFDGHVATSKELREVLVELK